MVFLLNRNLRVHVTLLKSYSPINKPVWNFRTQGLAAVGQDEVVILLIKLEGESLPARNIFEHLQHLYEQVSIGNSGLLATQINFCFCFLFVKKSLICLEGKSITPRRGNTTLFRSLYVPCQLPWSLGGLFLS